MPEIAFATVKSPSRLITPFEPSYPKILPFVVPLKFKVPALLIVPTIFEPTAVIVAPDLLITFDVTVLFSSANIKLPVFTKFPCLTFSFTVIVPAAFKVPLPVIVPKLLVPLTVKLPLLLIEPRFFKVSFTVVSFVFVNVFSVFTVNPF